MLNFLNRRCSKEPKEPHTPRERSDASSNTWTEADTSPSSPTLSITPSHSPPRAASTQSYGRARRTGVLLAALLSDPSAALPLLVPVGDTSLPLPALCYNGALIELRDMFRVVDAIRDALSGGSEGNSGGGGRRTTTTTTTTSAKIVQATVLERVNVFYQWFEGFFEIVTAIFDAEEDILFAYVSKAGPGVHLPNALCAKRRRTKKERAREACWDMLELKMQFDKRVERQSELVSLVCDLEEEAEQLAARVIAHFRDVKDGLCDVLDAHFGADERRLIESSYLGNLRATDAGRFVVCAFGRGYVDKDRRVAFLEEALRTPKNGKANVVKQVRKFQKHHTDLVHKVAPLPP